MTQHARDNMKAEEEDRDRERLAALEQAVAALTLRVAELENLLNSLERT